MLAEDGRRSHQFHLSTDGTRLVDYAELPPGASLPALPDTVSDLLTAHPGVTLDDVRRYRAHRRTVAPSQGS